MALRLEVDRGPPPPEDPMKRPAITNVIVVSDLHMGCQMALVPRCPLSLDGGGEYRPSQVQQRLQDYWDSFWGEWVPAVTRGEPYAVVVNGDATDGPMHHGTTTQWTTNAADVERALVALLSPIVSACEGRFYLVRGTECHVGPSGVDEERLARRLGAIPDREGRYSRWRLRLSLGDHVVDIAHHIGTAGSMHYRTSALSRELSEAYSQAARWSEQPPSVVVRSHRHTNDECRIRTAHGFATVCTTPAWQAKTPHAHRVAGARQSRPEFGGTLVRLGDEDIYTRHQVWTIADAPTEDIPHASEPAPSPATRPAHRRSVARRPARGRARPQ